MPPVERLREVILELFEQAREKPRSPYQAERLLAFLTDPPAKSGRRVADTFGGRRRLVRFMNQIQLEMGICFTVNEWERGYSLDDLVGLAAEKMAKPSQGLRLAKQRREAARARQVTDPVKFGMLTAPFLAGAGFAAAWPLRLMLILLWIAIVGAVAALAIGEVRYCRRLVNRMKAATQ
jgi:hypothetical protein